MRSNNEALSLSDLIVVGGSLLIALTLLFLSGTGLYLAFSCGVVSVLLIFICAPLAPVIGLLYYTHGVNVFELLEKFLTTLGA